MVLSARPEIANYAQGKITDLARFCRRRPSAAEHGWFPSAWQEAVEVMACKMRRIVLAAIPAGVHLQPRWLFALI